MVQGVGEVAPVARHVISASRFASRRGESAAHQLMEGADLAKGGGTVDITGAASRQADAPRARPLMNAWIQGQTCADDHLATYTARAASQTLQESSTQGQTRA